MTISTLAIVATAAGLLLTAACAQQAEMPEAEAAPQPDPEEAAVVAAVEQLFEAMRTGDSEMAAAVMHPDARLGRAGEKVSASGPPTDSSR